MGDGALPGRIAGREELHAIAGVLQVLESVLRCDGLGGDLPLHVVIVQNVLCTGVVIAGFILMLAGVPSVSR